MMLRHRSATPVPPASASHGAVWPRLISYRASVAMVSPQWVQRPEHTISMSADVSGRAASSRSRL